MPTVQGFKIPTAWDSNRPKFDGETASSLKLFLRNTEQVCDSGGITSEQEQKKLLLNYLDDSDIREQWQSLSMFAEAEGSTYKKWRKQILRLYPEVEDQEVGSIQKLQDICASARPISRPELGKLRRFRLAFETEAEKLKKGPSALVVNRTLVDLVLSVLEEGYSQEVEVAMNQQGIRAIHEGTAAGDESDDETEPTTRRGDRLSYKQVLKLADYIANNWTGRTAGAMLLDSPRANTSTRVPGLIPTLVSRDSTPMNSIKTEVNERLDVFAGQMAQLRDTAILQEKRLAENLKKMESSFENTVKLLSQAVKPSPPHMDNRPREQAEERREPREQREPRPDVACHFCNGPHYIRDCRNKDEFITLGWVKVEDGQLRLGTGGWIPRYPENLSRMQKVEEHFRRQGVTRESAKAQRAGMMQSFYSSASWTQDDGYGNGYTDRVDHLYDTTEDEIRSVKIQQMSRAPSQNYMAPSPVFQQSIPFPSTGAQPLASNGGVQPPQQFLQVPQGQFTSPPVQANNGIDISQLIQLFNAVRGEGTGGVVDQLVATRSGAKTDPPSNPNF
jgi:hypothetical protein